jgi:hypothetical protein
VLSGDSNVVTGPNICRILSLLFYNECDPGKGGFSNAPLMKMSYIFKNIIILINLYL